MRKNIDILIVEPGKMPQQFRSESTRNAFEAIVGGPIDVVGCYLPQRVMLVANAEAWQRGLAYNRSASPDGREPIAGTFLLCGFEGNSYISLTERQIATFGRFFALPEKWTLKEGRGQAGKGTEEKTA